jgi:hypothetical protein
MTSFALPFRLRNADWGLRIGLVFYWQVTQSVECRSVKAKVTGSIPVLSVILDFRFIHPSSLKHRSVAKSGFKALAF